jgi:hypothetical protein
MYIVKLNNRTLRKKMLKVKFKSYESARTVLKRYIRSLGFNSDKGYTCLGFKIQKV